MSIIVDEKINISKLRHLIGNCKTILPEMDDETLKKCKKLLVDYTVRSELTKLVM